jgi:hypothetical protein
MKTADLASQIRELVRKLASGECEDHDTMTRAEYYAVAADLADISAHLNSIAESFSMACEPMVIELLAWCAGQVRAPQIGNDNSCPHLDK